MPSKLRIERPASDESIGGHLRMIPSLALAALPIYLGYLWITKDQLPNVVSPGLAAWTHAIAAFAALGLAVTINLQQINVINRDESTLPHQEAWRVMPHQWWFVLPIFSPAVVAVVAAVVHASDLSAAAPPMPSPASLLLTWTTTFIVSVLTFGLFFTATPPRVSDEGYRTGLLHFIPWSEIHHVTRSGPALYLFHQSAPDGPIHALVTDPEIDAILDPHLRKHQIPITPLFPPKFLYFRLFLIVASFGMIAAGTSIIVTRLIDPRWVILMTFATAIIVGLFSDWWRGAFHIKMLRPQIEQKAEADERRAQEQADSIE